MAEFSHFLTKATGREQHVASLLPQMLPTKSLTINIVTDVAPFPDLCIDSGESEVQSAELEEVKGPIKRRFRL